MNNLCATKKANAQEAVDNLKDLAANVRQAVWESNYDPNHERQRPAAAVARSACNVYITRPMLAIMRKGTINKRNADALRERSQGRSQDIGKTSGFDHQAFSTLEKLGNGVSLIVDLMPLDRQDHQGGIGTSADAFWNGNSSACAPPRDCRGNGRNTGLPAHRCGR